MIRQQLPRSRHSLRIAVLALFALATPIITQAADILTEGCPTGIAVPTGNELALTVRASGVQIYTCTATPTTPTTPYTWVNTAEADLFKNGRKVGSHYFNPGPTWKIGDSEVKGARVCAVSSPAGIPVGAPAAASILWVLLSATAPIEGKFENVTYIQRAYTIAGTRSPDYACDTQHVGDVLRKPYAAYYRFSKAI